MIANANGQCGSWANLFRMILLVHGVQGSEHVFLLPKESTPRGCIFENGQWGPRPGIQGFPSGALGFIVKSYQFGNPGSGCVDYPYRFNDPCQAFTQWPEVDVVDAAGVVGQDSPNPASWFENHQIVRVLDKLYDPSYGTGPYQSVAQYESAAIQGLYGVAHCVVAENGQVTAIYLGVAAESPATEDLFSVDSEKDPE